MEKKKERGITMAIIKKQEKKNEKEEKSLQTGKNAEKVTLDDELLNDVAGGGGTPPCNDDGPGGEHRLGPGKF